MLNICYCWLLFRAYNSGACLFKKKLKPLHFCYFITENYIFMWNSYLEALHAYKASL